MIGMPTVRFTSVIIIVNPASYQHQALEQRRAGLQNKTEVYSQYDADTSVVS